MAFNEAATAEGDSCALFPLLPAIAPPTDVLGSPAKLSSAGAVASPLPTEAVVPLSHYSPAVLVCKAAGSVSRSRCGLADGRLSGVGASSLRVGRQDRRRNPLQFASGSIRFRQRFDDWSGSRFDEPLLGRGLALVRSRGCSRGRSPPGESASVLTDRCWPAGARTVAKVSRGRWQSIGGASRTPQKQGWQRSF